MKGMQKIKRGKQFEGAVFYVLKPGKHHKCDPYVIGGNLVGDMAREVIEEFNQSKQLRPDIEKAVWHNALRLKQGEMLSANAWVSFADDYMKRMGFSDTHLRCYVLHDDEAGQHIHIIASRIDLNGGKLYLGRNENLVSTRIISELEITHGLTVTKTAPFLSNAQPKRKRISRNEQMLSERTGLPSPKEALQQILDKSLTDTPDLLTFIKRLEEAEVGWTANVASTEKMNGFSFSYRDIAFKASQLGKAYSWVNLQKQLNYNPDHLEALRATKEAIPAPAPAGMVIKTARETLTISEKIASLSSSRAVPLPVAASLAPALASKMPKRQQMIDAVLDLQNAKKTKQVRAPRFTLWLPLLNLLKQCGFCLIHSFRRFKRVLMVRTLTPLIQTQLQVNIKQPK
ncbi:TPA: relaxase/mobilization nuclease domain-containing protein [Yersinia enterocolitica]|nr:relaxase/mobilization nuclease domain-containing protein [Yersinia enterocolitica]